MKREICVLIVDSLPMCVDACKKVIKAFRLRGNPKVSINAAYSIKEGLDCIASRKNSKPYDLIISDIHFPSEKTEVLTTGFEFVSKLKESFPSARLVILSSINDGPTIRETIKNIDPESLIIKTGLTPDILYACFLALAQKQTFYCGKVNEILKKRIQNEFLLDDINLKILLGISKGIRTKDLSDHINLSLSAIEKRKNKIKAFFDIESGGDDKLIEEARTRGFI
ncbi:response regulator [Spongiivirga citrea]|uniref:Response regulatory domain-containing protein n=1 Tax=Spongiivirga citrea TaxID=1481457 RepID=A0A6M0CU81_9FLAO|nr:response regulator [Spongiivirga citrea]NER17330.1 hypothetical protein [Spongiivirga citrea]